MIIYINLNYRTQFSCKVANIKALHSVVYTGTVVVERISCMTGHWLNAGCRLLRLCQIVCTLFMENKLYR